MKKRITALILSFVCVLLFTGCSSDEIALIAAMQKDAQITSVKTTEVLSGQMNITLPEEVKENMGINLQSMLNMLSSFRLEATTQQQIKGETATAKYQYALISDDTNFSGEMYTSVNPEQTQTIFKIPTLFKAMLPQQYENAVYCTIDTKDLQKCAEKEQEWARLDAQYYGYEPITETTLPKLPGASVIGASKLNNAIFECLKNYAMYMKDTPNLVTKSQNTYSLVISDQDFKDLLHSAVLTYFDSPEARNEIVALWNAIKTYYGTLYPEQMMANFPELPQLPEDPYIVSNMRIQAELIFGLLNNVRLIGEDGIRVTYTVNPKGYITEINADFHMDFDINAITEVLSGSPAYEEDFAFEIRLHYNQKRENINKKQTITFPTLTKENNLPAYGVLADTIQEEIDWLAEKIANGETYETEKQKDTLNLPAPDGSISIVFDNGYRQKLLKLDGPAPVINENGTLYVPLEPLMNWLLSGYGWNEETKMIFFRDPLSGKMIQYHPGDSVMYSDDYTITLSAPTLVKDGQDYLPLRAMISAFTDYKVSWNQEKNAVYITPWYNVE